MSHIQIQIPPRRLAVAGGQAALVSLQPGDRLEILDPEGGQPGVLILMPGAQAAAQPPGSWAIAPLPDVPESEAAALAAAAEAALPDGSKAWLQRSRAEGSLRVLTLFGPESRPGSLVSLEVTSGLFAILHAPGGPMLPEEQATVTELEVRIHAAPGRETGHALPAPLAEPILDLRIAAATASAFRVKAGDYIQIIDVDGRQCSDFLAFDSVALAAGREHGLDATTTRTLNGHSMPGPGLHGKFFDDRMVPLVEVVQDSVGRHDAFMLACTAKYYEDMGYPGHPNCSDNFSAALQAYQIPPRKGWPAINFFFNTQVNHDGSITSDEPWSRPGDYVLLRALTDLVCATSSCADDIDPANAWLPTDIHVRVYDGSNAFEKGISHRMTPDALPKLTRQSGFHPRTAALTRDFAEVSGFWLPNAFRDHGTLAEYWACRERAAIMDLSALRKFEVTGPDSERLMQLACTRDIAKLAVGQVTYTALCYEHGGMVDDATVYRLAPQNFRLVCGAEATGVWVRELAARHGLQVWVRSSTDQLHNIAVQGPKSREILARVVTTPPHRASMAELKWFRFTIGRVGPSAIPVVVSRTGYTGELGFELWCHPDKAAELWDVVMEAGAPDGLTPFGFAALDITRIEAGLIIAGREFSDETDPFEAGIGFAVAADKPAEYSGKEALLRRKAHPQRVLVGLEILSRELCGHGDGLYQGRARIGVVTSATFSPILDRQIALARVDVAHSTIGTSLEVGKLDGQQKRLAATVVRFPHFDPDKTRVRA